MKMGDRAEAQNAQCQLRPSSKTRHVVRVDSADSHYEIAGRDFFVYKNWCSEAGRSHLDKVLGGVMNKQIAGTILTHFLENRLARSGGRRVPLATRILTWVGGMPAS